MCIELLLLFCPAYYDEYGVLLEQCDRPSLFQAIGAAFDARERTTRVGAWLGAAVGGNGTG